MGLSANPVITISFKNNESVVFPGVPITGYVAIIAADDIKCKGASNQILASGEHHFPFMFTVPMNTPSSFESSTGHVRHTCKVTIERSLFKRNFRCVKPFSVSAIFDLNTRFGTMNPILQNAEKKLCCLCCTSGPISLLVNIDRSGFVPGENIIINADCSNKSNRIVDYTMIKLIQKRTFKAQGSTEVEKKEICRIMHGPIRPGGDDIWSGERLHVPPVVSSDLFGCGIIDIDYALVFKVAPSGAVSNLKLTMPIVIGTIPLRNVFDQFQTKMTTAVALPEIPRKQVDAPSLPPANENDPPPYSRLEGPSAPAFNFPGFDQYPEMPPPSYNECVFGLQSFNCDTSDDETELDSKPQKFVPKYVSYKLGPNQPRFHSKISAATCSKTD